MSLFTGQFLQVANSTQFFLVGWQNGNKCVKEHAQNGSTEECSLNIHCNTKANVSRENSGIPNSLNISSTLRSRSTERLRKL